MDAAGQVAQLLKRQLHLAVRLVDHRRRRVRVLQQLLLRQTEPHRQRRPAGPARRRADPARCAADRPRPCRPRPRGRTPARRSAAPARRTGDSSPRTIARSTLVSPRAMNGSTGHSTNSDVSVTAKVSDAPGQPDEVVQHRPPGHRVLQARPQPAEEARSAAPAAGSARRSAAPSSAARPRPLQPAQLPRAEQPGREQRQPDHRDGQPDPGGQHRHDVDEADQRRPAGSQEMRDLLPGVPVEGEARRRQPVAVGGPSDGLGGRDACGHMRQRARRGRRSAMRRTAGRDGG